MGGLSLYCVIGCLAFATAAPSEDASKVYTKNFAFANNNQSILPLARPFSKNELIYAACEGLDGGTRCEVIGEASDQDQSSVRTCNVSLPYTGRPDLEVVLANAGDSRAVFAVRDGAARIKLVSLSLRGCRVREASLDASTNARAPFRAVVVPREDDYDVVYLDQQLCRDNFCKATLDYEGRRVKEPAVFPLKHLPAAFQYDVRQNAANNVYLVSLMSSEALRATLTSVYLIRDGDDKPQTLYSGYQSGAVGLSTEESQLSFCVYENQTLVCKQYDGEGKTKKFETAVPDSIGTMDYLEAYNLEKGLLVAVIGRDAAGNGIKSYVVRFDEHGEPSKRVSVDLRCDEREKLLPKFYKKPDGQYCIASVCTEFFPDSGSRAHFSRSTRCFSKTELF